jgi:hypothetical protein
MPHLLNQGCRRRHNYLLQGVKVSLPTGKGVTKYSYSKAIGEHPDFGKMKPKRRDRRGF